MNRVLSHIFTYFLLFTLLFYMLLNFTIYRGILYELKQELKLFADGSGSAVFLYCQLFFVLGCHLFAGAL